MHDYFITPKTLMQQRSWWSINDQHSSVPIVSNSKVKAYKQSSHPGGGSKDKTKDKESRTKTKEKEGYRKKGNFNTFII